MRVKEGIIPLIVSLLAAAPVYAWFRRINTESFYVVAQLTSFFRETPLATLVLLVGLLWWTTQRVK